MLQTYKYKKQILTCIKTAIFQGLNQATSQFQVGRHTDQHLEWCALVPSPAQKCKHPHPGTLVKFLRVGLVAIEVKCPTYAQGSPPPQTWA